MILVACDICGRRYSLADERLGQRLSCKSCDVEFEVCRSNEFDPDSPEFPEESPVEQEVSDVAWSQVVVRMVGGVSVVVGLGSMISLLFMDPRIAPAATARPAGATLATSRPTTSAPSFWTPPPTHQASEPAKVAPAPSVSSIMPPTASLPSYTMKPLEPPISSPVTIIEPVTPPPAYTPQQPSLDSSKFAREAREQARESSERMKKFAEDAQRQHQQIQRDLMPPFGRRRLP